jgi:hypothetical protein
MGDGDPWQQRGGARHEGRYDIAFPVTGQHWRSSHALNPAPLPHNKREEEKVVKTAIGLLMLAPALTATPAAAQSIPGGKDAESCKAFDPKTACYFLGHGPNPSHFG